MASYSAPRSSSYKRDDGGSGAGVKVLAVFLGIAVGVLVIVSAVLIKMADDARDDAGTTVTAPATHDHSSHASSSVSLPIQSFAGVTGANAEELAKAHVATKAALPPVPAGELVKVHMTLKDMVVEIAPGVKYNTWASTATARRGPSSTSARGRRSR